jgi:predicted NAD/FAD-dependent oxidoreductase
VREHATSELQKIGELAISTFDKVLTSNPSLEMRNRVETMRKQSDPDSMILKGERLRKYRAVEVLERIGSPEARRLLTTYAKGAPGALLTTSADAALKR